jgi:hypothetical protein
MKITITFEDLPDGSVKVVAEPNLKTLISATKAGPLADSMAVAYALGALTKIAADSRRLKEKGSGRPLILLPPGTRGLS